MPKNGWIKLHRKIQEHWLWQSEKPFDKRSAWIDLLLLANHEDNKVLLGNELTIVKRGEYITSERKLAKRWGWSRQKVRDFLEILEEDFMIKIMKNHKRTRVKVLNYGDYQDREDHKKTTQKPPDIGQNEVGEKNGKKLEPTKKPAETIDITGITENKKPQKNHKKTTKKPLKNHLETQTRMIKNDKEDIHTYNIGRAFNKYIGMANVSKFQEIESYLHDGMSEEVIIEAMRRSQNKDRPADYCRGILINWLKKGIKTMADVESLDKRYKKDKFSLSDAERKKKLEKMAELAERGMR